MYNELVLWTQTRQEHWVDTGAEWKSTQIMAQTRLNERMQAAQLIINSAFFFFMVAAAQTGVVKNK